jgi:hypothetical protein
VTIKVLPLARRSSAVDFPLHMGPKISSILYNDQQL